MKKFARTFIIALLIVSILSTGALAASPTTTGAGTVKADILNLRSEANTYSAVKALIPNGSYLIVTGTVGEWYKVLYNGTEGYVHSSYVNYAQTLDGNYGAKGVISGTCVRLRSGASLYSGVVGYYNTGAEFTVLGVSGEWVKVSAASGLTGYVHSNYINCATESSSTSAPAAPAGSTGEQMRATAKQYLGCPYVWAGNGPYSFDCSGFVNYVYKYYGYSLHRVAQDIYSYDGTYVDKAFLQPGDIVCFGYGPWSITHVGMYIGNGQFIHASSGSGCVVITDLSSSYYTRMYVGAKRIIGQ